MTVEKRVGCRGTKGPFFLGQQRTDNRLACMEQERRDACLSFLPVSWCLRLLQINSDRAPGNAARLINLLGRTELRVWPAHGVASSTA